MTGSIARTALVAIFAAASTLFGAARFTIVVTDPPGYGFIDPRPAPPAPGNNGATVGEQRLNVLRFVAGIWSSKLDSAVPIRIRAGFDALPCSAAGFIGAEAGPVTVVAFTETDGEVIPYTWYPTALASKLKGTVADPETEEIKATFNLNIGQPDCIPGYEWYYGLDATEPAYRINMATLMLHELAHGLGFLPLFHPDASRIGGRNDVYSQYVVDTSTGKGWNEMTDAERAVSITNTGRVVWNGINVRKDVPSVLLSGAPVLRVTEPASIAGDIRVTGADFGKPVSTAISGELVLAMDPADANGDSATDACSPLTNAAQIAGRIALVDRGGCAFTQKALNVQAAGALGLVVMDSEEESPPPVMSGNDSAITITSVLISLADGKALKAALAGGRRANGGLLLDETRLAGTDAAGRPLLYTPNPVGDLSPVGHWDPIASPDQLMEPGISAAVGLSPDPPHDLTLSLLRDLGWFSDFDGVPDGVDQCPGSDRGSNLMILGCDTGVHNTTYKNGCRISDYYKTCTAGSGGGFTGCVDSVSKDLTQAGGIGSADAGKIQACAAQAKRP